MGRPTGARSWPRTTVVTVAVLLGLVAAAAIVHRVLAPAEVLTPARGPVPVAEQVPPGVIGTLNAAPLVVDDRVRVFATTRQVWADEPVDAKTRRTPYWSYRRWPAQVTGVLASGETVVTRWSDGEVVALDAQTGRVRWHAAGPEPEGGYAGRRTGAATVYAPEGLRTATARDGRRVLVVGGRSELRGIDLDSGERLWRVPVDGSCRTDGFTTATGALVAVDTCATPQVVEVRDAATGAPATRWRPEGAGPKLALTGLGCTTEGSACGGVRTGGGGTDRGWRFEPGQPAPVPAPELDRAGTVLVGSAAVAVEDGGVVARAAGTGVELWRRAGLGPARILAAQPGRVHLFTDAGDLVNLDPTTGAELSRYPLTYGGDSRSWEPGFAYAGGGLLAVERLAEPVDPRAADDRYYLAAQPVILAAG
ncbi:PQQ-binding-like beta-propeller repeat protein [Micromonospora sp. NPDC049559]|uniref:outer membrane protein assembly factor BamB family protein n=1 Tax=Micromonospora sp. NPDC049559 TaxID=3155923 RepID=UPI00343E6818